MKPTSQLTQQRLRNLLIYNPATGQFHWRQSPRYGIKIGDIAGEKKGNRIQIDGVFYNVDYLRKLYVLQQTPPGFVSVLECETQGLAGLVAKVIGPDVIKLKLAEFGSDRISTLSDEHLLALQAWLFDKLSGVEAPVKITVPDELTLRVKEIVAETLAELPFISVASAFPEMAKLLREDLAYNPGAEGVYLPPEVRIADTLSSHQSPLITAQLLAELSGVGYASQSKLTWAATLRRAGWIKLSTHLLTKHGACAIYCRRDDAAEWAAKSPAELRTGLPEGICVSHQGVAAC